MNYNLFLDDERDPEKVSWVRLPNMPPKYGDDFDAEEPKWVVARDYTEFVRLITDYGLPVNISFDHDLSDAAYMEFDRARNFNVPIKYSNIPEKTGYDCAKWLVEYCRKNKLPLPNYTIHSFNPIGAKNIKSILDSYSKHYEKTRTNGSNRSSSLW